MATYRLSNVTEQYSAAAHPPELDRIAFTIDHIHAGDHDICSTYEVVKFLVDKNIPVTLFMQATNPSNNYDYDRNNARMIYQLAPTLVTLGVHPLPAGNTQQAQSRVHNTLRDIIKDVTGAFPEVLSYHGAGAGPEPDITFDGIKYARGILSAWAAGTDDPKNTPVMAMNSVNRAFVYTSQRNVAGYSATVFIHTNELSEGSTKKLVFDTLIQSVIDQKIQAQPYLSAMDIDFKETVKPPKPPSPTPTPSGSGAMGSLRLSASSKAGRRPVSANFLIEKLDGDAVDSAQDVKTKSFRIPVGQYKITATIDDITETATIDLTATQGIHHIFLMPAAGGVIPPTPTPPPSGSTLFGSLRLSASTKVGRRPLNVDFLIEGVDSTFIDIATNLKTKTFRIPVGRYKLSAKNGSIVETAIIDLTASQGIHHIFLMPSSDDGSPTVPTPTPTPPANTNSLGSLRLSASTKVGRRPVAVDFSIEKMNGDDIRDVTGVTTKLFRLPAGDYKTTATLGTEVITKEITLTANQGVHHIFLMPT